MSTNPGSSFGKYHVIAELGRGGMAEVFLAVVRGPAGFNKLVVLKKLRTSLLRDLDNLAMFLDEARLAARLNHPNVVQTNEVGQADESYFIAMEYLEGQAFSSVLKRHRQSGAGPLPLATSLRIVADASAGLHYAHGLKDFDGTPLQVVHRDVSPHNVFLTYGGQVKLVDFGIAKANSRTIQTESGILKGKVAYMAPEQAQGLELDHRADIFAMGVVLFEAVCGERLWGVPDIDIVRELLMSKVPRSPKDVIPTLPDEVVRICKRALSPIREERYQTALELQRDLEKCLSELPERVTNEEIGNHVSQLFAQEREKISGVIERQLGALARLPHEEFLSHDIPTLTISGGVSVTPSGARQSSTPSGSARISIEGAVSTPALSPPSASSVGDEKAITKKRALIAGAIAVVAVVAVIAFVASRSSSNTAVGATGERQLPSVAPKAASAAVRVSEIPEATAQRPEPRREPAPAVSVPPRRAPS